MIYLDSAATTMLKPPSVEHAMVNAVRSMASPGRGGHSAAMRAAKTVYDCRIAASELFNVDSPDKVVFTHNATHALNIAISSLANKGDKVVISGFEHNSVTRPLNALGAEIVIAGAALFDPEQTLEDFEKNIPHSKLAVCTMVSNVFGYILPIYEISKICRNYSVPLIIDASQAAGVLEVDFSKLNAAFIAMPGHKGLMGPQGTGLLLCGQNGRPLLHGGSGSDSISQHMPEYLPDTLEAGTPNVCGIAGLLHGIKYIIKRGTKDIYLHEKYLLEKMLLELKGIDVLRMYYGEEQSGVLSVVLYGFDCECFASQLSERGIYVRAGLHCAPFAHKSAGTLDTGTVRFSFSPFVTETQVLETCIAIKEIANKIG